MHRLDLVESEALPGNVRRAETGPQVWAVMVLRGTLAAKLNTCDRAKGRRDPTARQVPHAANTSVSSPMSGVKRSPKTCAARPIPPCSTKGVYSNDSGEMRSSEAMFSFIQVSHCN